MGHSQAEGMEGSYTTISSFSPTCMAAEVGGRSHIRPLADDYSHGAPHPWNKLGPLEDAVKLVLVPDGSIFIF